MVSKLVGILNLTPDSFSDGGKFNQIDSALNHLQKLISDGADVIDIGAESTRPNAIPITHEEEWGRLKDILPNIIDLVKNKDSLTPYALNLTPKLMPSCNQSMSRNARREGRKRIFDTCAPTSPQHDNLMQRLRLVISLDSRHPQTIAKALELGIDIINDVTGFENPEMIKLAAQSGKKIIVMHNLGVPADKNKIISEQLDVVEVLISWMENKLQQLLRNGVKKEQIIFDPGIGFGKSSKQAIQIIQEIDRFKILDLPILIGHSKKSFLDEFEIAGIEKNDREAKTIHISKFLASRNIDYLRVHDVAEHTKFFKSAPFN